MGTPETDNSDATMNRLVEILSDRLEWPLDAATGEETPLGEEGLGLDSLMVVEFALDMEECFELEFNEDEMLGLAGMTLRGVADFITLRITQKAS